MPVGSISLPVTHLPSACSFYLEALQSLKYRFIEEKDGKIGFGPDGTADLFLHQASENANQGISKDSSAIANITFTAPSAAAIDDFARAAIRAGGSVLAEPVLKDCEFGTYCATVSDLDGNRISCTCNDPTMSTASYPMSVAPSRRSDDGSASDQVSDGTWRIKVRTSTSGPSDNQSTGDSSANALVGTLLGVAAGAALTYLVGKERQTKQPPSVAVSSPSQAPSVKALPYIQPRQIEYPCTPRSSSSVPIADPADYFAPRPQLLRSVTYHYDYQSLPPSPEASPEAYRYPARSHVAPSISEARGSVVSNGSKNERLMIEAPPCRVSERSHSYRQTLPPSPPSSVSSRSHRSRRAYSPSPVRSSHSKASSRRSHSVASSQRTIRPELIALPASVATSRVSAPRSVASSHRPKQPGYSTYASSEASWHSAEQSPTSHKTSVVSSRNPANTALPESRQTSVVSRSPADIALPESRKTSVVSRHPADIELPESRPTSIASRSPSGVPLPESRKTSVVSRDSFRTSASRQSHEYSLPGSRHTSVAPHEVELPASEVGSRHSSSTLKPRKSSSTTSKEPHRHPLPESRKTSVASRIPEDIPLPRSEASSRVSTNSTLKPAKPSASAIGFKEEDTESLAPSDSISQISVKKHRKKHHHHHHDKRSDSGSKHGSHTEGKKRSVVSMPEREIKKEKEKRSVATLLGL